MPVGTMSSSRMKAEVKRKVLALASKLSTSKVNDKVNSLLIDWEVNPSLELELELTCWAEIWLSRRN